MNTISILVLDAKAERLLHDLEDLHLIKVLTTPTKKPKQKLSKKYAEKLPSEIVEEFQKYVTEGRKQWEERNI